MDTKNVDQFNSYSHQFFYFHVVYIVRAIIGPKRLQKHTEVVLATRLLYDWLSFFTSGWSQDSQKLSSGK